MANAWIFQANPKKYDLFGAFHAGHREIAWVTRKHFKEIHVGDVVYLWLSGKEGGLVAWGRIVSEPGVLSDSIESQKFWLEPPSEKEELRVKIRVEHFLGAPIPRTDIVSHPVLSQMQIIRISRGTNFPLTEDEATALADYFDPEVYLRNQTIKLWEEGTSFFDANATLTWFVSDVNDDSCQIQQLGGAASYNVTFADLHAHRQQHDNAAGPFELSPDHAVSARTALLFQLTDLAMTFPFKAARNTGFVLRTNEEALTYFCQCLERLHVHRSAGQATRYKPAMIAALIEAFAAGEIATNQIDFDALLPFFRQKMQDIGEPMANMRQATEPFFHLATDGFWLVSYYSPKSFSREQVRHTAKGVREHVRHASIKETYWRLFSNDKHRQQMLATLGRKWWPEKCKTNQPAFWWVNQGSTFAEERQDGYVWAPQKDKANNPKFHHENVSKIREGDIIFHYCKGDICAVSVTTSAGQEQDKPDELSAEPWKKEGWIATCDYFDLPDPLELEKVARPLRLLKLAKGPINTQGKVNQGYLYHLNREAALVMATRLNLADLPAELADVLAPLVDQPWERFVYWAQRVFTSGDVRKNERGYKLELQPVLAEVHEQITASNPEWTTALKKAFGHKENNLTYHISHSKLLEWCSQEENKQAAADALCDLWDRDTELSQAVDSFLDAMPKEAAAGAGTRCNLTSFLALRRDPPTCPAYVTTPYDIAYRLTHFPVSRPLDDKSTYQSALDFLDRFIAEAARRGFVLEDRLDAQSAMYAVAKYELSFACFNDWTEEDKSAFSRYQNGEGEIVVPPTGLAALADDLLFDLSDLENIERLINAKRQVIFYGPPGTGKTYVALQLAEYLAGSKERTRLVQFHPSYSYEDFVEGFRPYLHGGQPGFKLLPGPLRQIAQQAQEDPENQYVLVIDEINRGNIAKIFGELFFLLEYRGDAVRLQYSSDEDFTLPENLLLIGTMNTADQSIALLDAALRRRFFFAPFFPNQAPVEGLLNRWLKAHKPSLLWLAEVVDRANAELGDWNAAIGPSYFLQQDLDESQIKMIWRHSIIPFIEDRFFGEVDRVKAFELERLRRPAAIAATETDGTDETASAD